MAKNLFFSIFFAAHDILFSLIRNAVNCSFQAYLLLEKIKKIKNLPITTIKNEYRKIYEALISLFEKKNLKFSNLFKKKRERA